MPSTEVLIAFTAAALLLNISPGPSNFYIISRSISQGTRGGVVAALGLAAGSMVHVTATVVGISAVFRHSPTLYTAIKLLGAAYLIYLAISYWKSSSAQEGQIDSKASEKPLRTVFWESIIVEVTNPKTALFFVALLPQFVVPESGSVSLQLFILGLIVTVSALPCDILFAVSSSRAASWLGQNQTAQKVQQRVSAAILFVMGAFIIADETRGFSR